MASFFQRFNIDDNQITETAKNKHKRLDCQTWQFFSCSNSLRLPVHYDTTSKNTVAHSTFEHLDHHNISKSSFYHTNHTFLTSINVWMMDFWSINARIKKNSSAQNTILCREWLLQKLTFHHNEITIFKHSQYPNQRTFGEPPAPSVYICIYTWCISKHIITYTYTWYTCIPVQWTLRLVNKWSTGCLVHHILQTHRNRRCLERGGFFGLSHVGEPRSEAGRNPLMYTDTCMYTQVAIIY